MTPGAPSLMWPMTAAWAKPCRRKIVITLSTASSAHATNSPPEVCGSHSSARCKPSSSGASCTSRRVGRPVARRGAGHAAGSRHREHVIQQRNVRHAHACVQACATAHLEQMAKEAKARDVGHRVHARQVRKVRARDIESCRRIDQRAVVGFARRSFLSAADRMPTPRGLPSTSTSPARASELRFTRCGMNDADGGQAIDGFCGIDAVTARDRNARLRADRFAAAQDLADDFGGQHVDRHAENRERQDAARRPSRRRRSARWWRRFVRSRTDHRRSA